MQQKTYLLGATLYIVCVCAFVLERERERECVCKYVLEHAVILNRGAATLKGAVSWC